MSHITKRIWQRQETVKQLFLSWREQYIIKQNQNLMECQPLPLLDVERRESFKRCLTCEKLEAALCVPDPSHTKEPNQEVKAVHKKCTKYRSLWQKQNSGYFMVGQMQSPSSGLQSDNKRQKIT